MKNRIKLFGFIACLLTAGMLLLCTACELPNGPGPDDTPTVTSVTINAPTTAVEKGGSITFSATVSGTNSPAQTVTWSIVETGKHAQTTIGSSSGVLNVSEDETLTTLTIKATSTADTSKFKTISINVYEQGQLPTVSGVSVSPSTTSVAKGGNTHFYATVSGTNNPPQTVTWSIVQSNKNAATIIDEEGTLYVAANETLNALTVKATSTVDPSKSGTAAVTLTAPAGKIITITNISSSISGEMSVTLFASLDNLNEPAAYGSGVIANRTLTVTLFAPSSGGPIGPSDPGEGGGGEEEEIEGPTGWNGTGPFYIALGAGESPYIYTNGANITGSWKSAAVTYNIQAGNPSINFNLFKEVIPGAGGTELTISGLEEFNDSNAEVYLIDDWDKENGTVAYGDGTISSGSITFRLMNASFEGWTESGPYWIRLEIESGEKGETTFYYTNGQTLEALEIESYEDLDKLPQYTFNGTNKSIAIGQFKEGDFGGGPGPSQPTVWSVDVTPTDASIDLNSGTYTQQFSATVNGVNLPPNGGGVTWNVQMGQSEGTSIDDTGLLTVAIGETSDRLRVIATSIVDSDHSGYVDVNVTPFSGQLPEVTSVVIGDKATIQGQTYERGTSVSLAATVTGTNLDSVTGGNEVTWSVSGNTSTGTSGSTGIDNTLSMLHIGFNETSPTLVVTARSKIAPNKYDTVTINVNIPPPEGKQITVNGLGSFANQYVDISIRDDLSNLLYGESVASGYEKIAGASATVTLFYDDGDNYIGWNDSGNYWVLLSIGNSLYIYTNNTALPNPITGAPKVNITQDNTTLAFSAFREIVLGVGGNTLTLSGLNAYNGGQVMAVIVDPAGQSEEEMMVAVGQSAISGNQVTLLLAIGSGAGWTGSGQYPILLNINANNNYFTYVYSNGGTWESLNIENLFAELIKLPKYTFSGSTATIALSQFALAPEDDDDGGGDPGEGGGPGEGGPMKP